MAIHKDELDTWLESLNTMYHGYKRYEYNSTNCRKIR
jgi:hypothetical protein